MTQALFCADEGKPVIFANLPEAILSLALFLIAFPLTVHFVIHLKKLYSHKTAVPMRSCPENCPCPKIKSSTAYTVSYASLVVCATSLLCFTSIGKFACYFGNHSIAYIVSVFGHLIMYVICLTLLMIIFLLRLQQTFAGTRFAVAKKSMRVLFILTCACPAAFGVALALFSASRTQSSAVVVLLVGCGTGLTYIGLTLTLLYMYIHRLRLVTESILSGEKNEDLFDTMIKLVILVSFCVVTTLVNSTFGGVASVEGSSVYVINNMCIIIDSFVNSILFMLQFRFNQKCYFRLCGSCHSKCKNLLVPEKPMNVPRKMTGSIELRVSPEIVRVGSSSPTPQPVSPVTVSRDVNSVNSSQ